MEEIMFKKTNGKRRWRRICKLDGYCRKDIKFYSEYERERQKEWLKDNCGQWHGNACWKQHCDSSLNRQRLFRSHRGGL